MLSADVSVFTLGGDLKIVGTSGDDNIVVEARQDESTGGTQIVVAGLDGTTLNGGQESVVAFEGDSIPDDLRIATRGGNDTVTVQGLVVGDDVKIATDSYFALFYSAGGDDRIFIDRVTVGDDMVIRTGGGADAVQVERSTIEDDTRIDTGSDDDLVALVNNALGDRLLVNTGGGGDAVFLDPTAVGGKATVSTGQGNDRVFVHGANADEEHDFASRVRFDGGSGYDEIELDEAKGLARAPGVRRFEIAASVTVVEFSFAEGIPVRGIPAGDPPGTGATAFSLEGVNFSGGEVSFAGFGPAYVSPPASYLVDDGQTAEISFDQPAERASLSLVNLGGGVRTATAFDVDGNIVATAEANPTTFLGNPANFVTFEGAAPIARIVLDGGVAIDNVAFA